jgi:translation initiation factor IF-2
MTNQDSNNDDGKKKLGLSRPGKLTLNKTVETGTVRQSFSHGRSKSVTVEVKKKRTFERGTEGRLKEVKQGQKAPAPDIIPDPVPTQASTEARQLTNQEREARLRALKLAQQHEEELRARGEEEAARAAARRAEEEKQRLQEEEDRRKRAEEEEARQAAEEEARKKEEETARKQAALDRAKKEAEAVKAAVARKPAATDAPAPAGAGAEDAKERRPKPEVKRPTPSRKGEPRRRQNKLTVTSALDDDQGQRARSDAAFRRARERERRRQQQSDSGGDSRKQVRDVVVPETITVQELANRMAERGVEVVKQLMKLGVMATINQTIDADTAELVVSEFGHRIKRVSESDVEIGLVTEDDDDNVKTSRPPVVTVMGHVDHGKTSLLDALRETDVAGREAGGITQHIGAYQVRLGDNQRITFIDTPGHAAFTAMRARGAKATDIVVLVVAADDGVMPQTVEAITHAKAAEVPIIVAINKIDKPDATPERVRSELLQHEIILEEFGGDVLAVEVSALKGTGLDKLEETILLQAELLELKANPDRDAQGVVIEAKMERGRGSVATVLIQRGTLRVGDVFVAGDEWGRVRAMINERGEQVEEAGPSDPVEVLGLQGTPMAGDDLIVVADEARAREITSYRQDKARTARTNLARPGTLDAFFASANAGEVKQLPVVIKSDVQGSSEAIVGALEKMGNDEVSVRVLHAGVGGINESDVTLAQASNALVIGFNVRANPQAREFARTNGIDIRYYSIIYDVADDIKKALSGMLDPTLKETLLGYAEIREVFNITKVGKVAGCRITEGSVRRGAKVRLLRDDVVIHEGSLSTLKRHKDDVQEVKEGYECGMSFENYNDIQIGDFIECFSVEDVATEL